MKQNLQEAFKGLAKVVCGKTTLPILACVRLKSENSTLTISGTDLEQWLDYRIRLEETRSRWIASSGSKL
jgi:DNA polymerase III sliding clamp (beta) subunit (PCNA family)